MGMRSVNFIIVFICLFFSSNAISSNDMKLKGYHCPTAADAKSCSVNCKKNKELDLYFEFKVNVRNSVIISNMYDGKELFDSVALENCRVVDSKNWICVDNISSSPIQTHLMTNGIYSFFASYSPTGMCAK